ncbi:MAG: hypothetical protein H0V76_11095 [Blastocatellia bacterium]|nr:hypothetical protein [Blastocatellia bacterium]
MQGDRENDFSIDEIAREAGTASKDEIKRRVLRGDETKGDPDERDNAGALEYEETPSGYEEIKTQIEQENGKDD